MADTSGGGDMNRPTWFTNNLTLGNVVTLVVLLAGGSYAYGRLENRIDNIDTYRVERSRVTDEKFAGLTKSLENLPQLAFRITANEEGLKATNARLDASLQTLSARIAEMNQLLGSVDTKIAVLTQRLEMTAPQRRAEAARPPG